jgi:hypothetical protein
MQAAGDPAVNSSWQVKGVPQPQPGQAGSYQLAGRISTDKRYDSIGSAPAGIVGVGSALIPGHFRLGRLNEAAGVCGGRGPSMVLNWVPDFG